MSMDTRERNRPKLVPARPGPPKEIRVWLACLLAAIAALALVPGLIAAAAPAYQIVSHQAYLPFAARSPAVPMPPPPGDWLGYVNYHREIASLPPLAENPEWSAGAWLHARYIVKNDVLKHSENPANPWYTPEGAAAAEASNLFGSFNPEETIEWTIDGWMQAPFHALGILDPALTQTGYGLYSEADGGLASGAALDVIRGLASSPPTVDYPILWPGDNTSITLTEHWGEYPDPLASCPGFQAPAGLPILLQAGPGGLAPAVTASDLQAGGLSLEHCVFSETTYTHPDPVQKSLGRGILASRDGIVLIPRQPLTPGVRYTVSLTVDGLNHSWSFEVAAGAETGRAIPAGAVR